MPDRGSPLAERLDGIAEGLEAGQRQLEAMLAELRYEPAAARKVRERQERRALLTLVPREEVGQDGLAIGTSAVAGTPGPRPNSARS